MSTIPITIRLSPDELASALDGLLDNNHQEKDLTSITSIVRTTFYYGLMTLYKEKEIIASDQARQKISQLINQNKKDSIISLQDIMNKTKG